MGLKDKLKRQLAIHRSQQFKGLIKTGLRHQPTRKVSRYALPEDEPAIEITVPQRAAQQITAPAKKQDDIVGTSNNLFKKLAGNIVHCYDKSMNMLTLYNLRHEGLIGVDITPNCIYLCKIDGLNGKRVLTSLTSVCMEGKFMTEDIRKNPEEYADSLKSLVRENNIKSKNVALSIPVSNAIVKTVTLPAMDDDEIKRALKFGSLWNNLMQSNQNPEDYSIFYQVIRRNRSHENMDVLFVATKLSDVGLYTDIIEKSGLNPVIVDVRCFAINNAFNHKLSTPSGPSVFLEFSFDENYALIVDGDGAQIFQINVTEKERKALIDNIMDEAVIDSFVQSYASQVKNTIADYEYSNSTPLITNICVMSSVPLTNIIIEKLTKALDSYNISHCNFFDCMKIQDDFTIGANSAKQALSTWGACIGNALRRIDIFGTSAPLAHNTNFLPNAGQYEHDKRAKYIASGACAIASLAFAYFVGITQFTTRYDGKALSMQLATLQGVESRYNKNALDYKNLSIATNSIDDIDKLIDSVSGNQRKLLSVHQYLAEVMVENVWLKEMTFTAPDKIEIHAASTKDSDILEFIDLLNGGKQFEKVALKAMQEMHEMSMNDPYATTVKNFKIQGQITNMPIPDPNKIHIMAGEVPHGS